MRKGELLYMSEELCKMLDKDGMVAFRDNEKQPYAIFKLADVEGAVANFGGKYYVVKAQLCGKEEE